MNKASDQAKNIDAQNWKVLKRILLSLVVLFVTVAILFLNQFRDVPVRVSKSTTMVTGPLNSEGKVNYAKALEEMIDKKNVASPENGFRFLVQSTSAGSTLLSREQFIKVCKRLGLEPGDGPEKAKFVHVFEQGDKYFDSAEFDPELIRRLEWEQEGKPKDWSLIIGHEDKHSTAFIIEDRSRRPWTDEDLPMMTDWVRENDPVLDLFAKAVRKKLFEIPIVAHDEQTIEMVCHGPVPDFRSVSRGFLTRACFHAGNGRTRQAIDDIISSKRLGRHLRNQPSFYDRIIGGSLEGMANATGIIHVVNDRSTEKDLAYFANELKSLPELVPPDQCLPGEKLSDLVVLGYIANNKSEYELEGFDNVQYLRNLGLDWNIVFKEYHKAIDREWQNRFVNGDGRQDIQLTRWDYLSRAARSRKFANWYATTNSFYFDMEEEWRIQGSDQLLELTIALLRYEKANGTLPPAFTVDRHGKPLHSWRVLILPYLGQQQLFEQIKLNEPWNSAHNSRFSSRRPDVYRCFPCKESSQSETCYSVVIGPDLPFDGGQGTNLNRFGKECDEMILIVERTDPIHWMDPAKELTFKQVELGFVSGPDIKKSPSRIAGRYRSMPQVGFRNISAHCIPDDLDPETLKALFKGTHLKYEIR